MLKVCFLYVDAPKSLYSFFFLNKQKKKMTPKYIKLIESILYKTIINSYSNLEKVRY